MFAEPGGGWKGRWGSIDVQGVKREGGREATEPSRVRLHRRRRRSICRRTFRLSFCFPAGDNSPEQLRKTCEIEQSSFFFIHFPNALTARFATLNSLGSTFSSQ